MHVFTDIEKRLYVIEEKEDTGGHLIVEEMSRVEKKRKRQNRRLIFYFSLVEMMTWSRLPVGGLLFPFCRKQVKQYTSRDHDCV